MARCVRFSLLFAALAATLPASAQAGILPNPDSLLLAVTRGPGGYLSIIKLVLLVVVFLLWVKLADLVNRDSVRWVKRLDMKPEVWNVVVVGSFLVGFLVAISVPMFLVGYPIFLVAALGPPIAYYLTRRSKIAESPAAARAVKAGSGGEVEALPQDDGISIDFSPAGSDKKQQQVNLITARQSSGFVDFKELLHDSMFKRAEQLMLDFAGDQVNSKILVDGVWHPREPQSRESGDPMLSSMKSMAGLNPADRRNRQHGKFTIKTDLGKANLELTSQGVKTGERAILKFIVQKKSVMSLAELGMFPEMIEKLTPTLNQEGLGIVSAPPGTGLSTSWRGVLTGADRLTRDCVAIIDANEKETRVENYVIHEYDADGSIRQLDVLNKAVLTQPNLYALPAIDDSATMDALTRQVMTENRSVLTQVKAKSAAEGLLRVYSKAADRDQFAAAVNFVTNQRLLRRLCDDCKQEVRVNPKTIQQLGGDPKSQKTLHNQWRLPPPEQRVDKKGKPIDFPTCNTCGGLGYVGRIAIFELLEVDDSVRSTLKSSPKIEAIEQAAKKAGKKSLASQAYRLVLLGVTSLAEAQRIMKQS